MQSLLNLEAAPFNGPFCGRAVLLDSLASAQAPYEGLWVPARFAKSLSLELVGVITTMSLQLYGTNVDAPLNTYKITIGGSITAADVVTATFKNQLLPGGSAAPSYAVQGGDTTTTIATALAAAINANAALSTLGFSAVSAAAVVTITFPSLPLQAASGFQSPSDPQQGNFTSIATSVSGSATETAAVAAGTDGQTIGAAITALGLTQITPPLRWLKTRVTALNATSLSAFLAMVG